MAKSTRGKRRNAAQLDLFSSALRCDSCGRVMLAASNGQRMFCAADGMMVCPGGCGSAELSYTDPEPDEERCGSWFDAE